MRKVSLTILPSMLLFALCGHAQQISGSIAGRLIDQQGAVISSAAVTITEPSKNVTITAKTNESGTFVFPALQPGSYTISASAPGFKKLEKTHITLDANDKLALGDLLMEVGAVTESVEVAAQGVLLQTESVDRSATISNRQMENIEVNGRNPLDMTKLIPGVVNTSSFQVGGAGGLGGINVNGNRGSANQLTINGIGNIDTGSNGSQNVTVSLDSMAEFKILTGMYQAEYGRNAGAQISMVTKSGTDQFHGSGYFYHRHEEFNANTWLNNANSQPRSLYRYNDPGYTIGGPVFIPKLLHATKDKLFFFWSQEWQNQLVPNTPRNVVVPTAAERQGDLSHSVDQNGKPITIKDPTTGKGFAKANVIPASQLYAPGIALLNLFPLPNVSGQTGYNYASQVSGHQPRREDLLRIDYNVSSKWRVFGHYINNAQRSSIPMARSYWASTFRSCRFRIPIQTSPGTSWAGGATYIINPTTTNEFNMGTQPIIRSISCKRGPRSRARPPASICRCSIQARCRTITSRVSISAARTSPQPTARTSRPWETPRSTTTTPLSISAITSAKSPAAIRLRAASTCSVAVRIRLRLATTTAFTTLAIPRTILSIPATAFQTPPPASFRIWTRRVHTSMDNIATGMWKDSFRTPGKSLRG